MKVLKKMLLFFKYQMTSCFIAWHVTALIMFIFICGLFFNRRGVFLRLTCVSFIPVVNILFFSYDSAERVRVESACL